MADLDRYKLFFEASTDAMLTLQDDCFVDCNKAALKMLGLSEKHALKNLHPADISPLQQPDGRSSFEKAGEMINKAVENGTHRFEWVHCRKNKDEFAVEVVLIVEKSSEGNFIHVVWHDISARHALEEALWEAKLLGEAVNQSGASTLITDVNGRIEYANAAFCQINGYKLDEVIGRTPKLLNSGQQDTSFYEDMWDVIKAGETWSGTLRNVRKNGESYWARLKISPVKDENGKVIKFVGIETDISDFIEAKEKAEQASRAKSDFLSSVSHELRTPLNSILGFSQLIALSKQNPLSERQKTQLDHIHNAGSHLLHLIDEVLDLAKIETGKMSYRIEKIEISDILDDCLTYIDTAYKEMKVSLHDETFKPLPCIKADSMRVRQVLLNLLSNAKKYNRKGGMIRVRSEQRDSGHLRIVVDDTGYGIPYELQDQIFQPFNRLGAERLDVEGAGIGLVLTKKMIEEMSGNIGFSSVEGEGSSFWLDFVIAEETKPVFDPIHIERSDYVLSCCAAKHTILYIEDNSLNRELMDGFVSEIQNLDMVMAETAEQGIELAKTRKPHLILMDINLPGMDGFEAFQKLREMEETMKIPVVALSANAMPDVIEKADSLGFQDYITKPFMFDDVMKVLDKHIEN
ncbi:MAG: PAS domain-containing protein [Terasakiella sp.]|uniref:hybrid sensor histidine kinase/response regulator n=1 Tax=unclassified Terasakiella TaxID=2614952 RepID=UPI003AFFCB1C